MNHSWICCQLGAREHYALPRVLHRAGYLRALITDLWSPPGASWSWLPSPQLQQRYHPELAAAPVISHNAATLFQEARLKLAKRRGWDAILERNAWFQSQVVRSLPSLGGSSHRPLLFSYSYAALAPLRWAKARGWPVVLGQIDPGLTDSQLVANLGEPSMPPPAYWQQWQEEWAIADVVVVNSEWSRQALRAVQVPDAKIRVIPLAYGVSQPAAPKTYPDAFCSDRPLRILFLGRISRRKGILPLLEALPHLDTPHWELWLIGTPQIPIPAPWDTHPQVRWFGAVPRAKTAHFYQQADVFILPTYSDGFALTQLEAQAWNLPVLASPFCGDVVRDGENGILLPEVSTPAIATALNRCLTSPGLLAAMAKRSRIQEFSYDHLLQHLITLDHDLS